MRLKDARIRDEEIIVVNIGSKRNNDNSSVIKKAINLQETCEQNDVISSDEHDNQIIVLYLKDITYERFTNHK